MSETFANEEFSEFWLTNTRSGPEAVWNWKTVPI
jgi:hypothetical protein